MADYLDFELGLSSQDPFSYVLEMRYDDPEDPSGSKLDLSRVKLDTEKLRQQEQDSQAYGKTLTDNLFAEERVREIFRNARTNAEQAGKYLRLRLFIHRTSQELHEVRWETLRDPADGSWLLVNENILFSRFLRSTTWERVQRRSRGLMRCLLAVAAPKDIATSEEGGEALASIDVEREIRLAQSGLGNMPTTVLGEGSKPENRATMDNIIEKLRQGYDVLYLVCHGTLRKDLDPPGPYIYLEKEDGTTDRQPGGALVERIKNLPPQKRPRLVVLASCLSAGSGETPDVLGETKTSDKTGALAALGPQLAQIGLPAVMAMQGSVQISTIEKFMPVFFKELLVDGQIDRAMTAARGKVKDEEDGWMPVLFLRLRDGRLWSGYNEVGDEFDIWTGLINAIVGGECTAILGPGLTEPLIGTRRDIALRWADEMKYPLSPYDREDFPRVAQYVESSFSEQDLRNSFREALRFIIEEYYPGIVSQTLKNKEGWEWQDIMQVVQELANNQWSGDNPGPFHYLARLRLKMYISANYFDFLSPELVKLDPGIQPQRKLCPWYEGISEENYKLEIEPSQDQPLIYHLYGHFDEPDSLVLTEDDYLDYLIGITTHTERIPVRVKRALTQTSLLFLGFRVDDWTFRTIFRVIQNQPGSPLLRKRIHAAVQITPDEGRITDYRRTRSYLERYFDPSNIRLYWGSSEDFLKEITERREARKKPV